VVEQFPLTFGGYTYRHGVIAYVRGRAPAPVILVHHNYAGLKQFDIDQCCFLARAGYVGVAVDHYRETDLIGAPDASLEYRFEDRDPKRDLGGYGSTIKGQVSEAQKARVLRHGAGSTTAMMGLLRTPNTWRAMMSAWLELARGHSAVHPHWAGAIGYCLGGQALLEQVRAGHELQAVVSFHGLLHSRPQHPTRQHPRGAYFDRLTAEEFMADPSIEHPPNHHATGCAVLIENGDADPHVPAESIEEFRAEMDQAGIDWRINNHARTPHGFALAPGMWGTAYHEDADRRSTISMLQLFAETWPDVPQSTPPTNACGTVLGQAIVVASKL
jgi:dienelactone hydrolase